MDNGPYNIKGSLLVVKPWPSELTSEEVDLSSCAFWVQVHGLPLQNMMVVNAIKIGKRIGLKVLDVEDGDKSGIISHHHLRIRILLDVSLPLVPSFHLPRSGRSAIWIKFLYERLADYCTLCGCIGHQKSFCPAPPPLGLPDRYGTSLRGYVYPGTRRMFSSRHASGSSSPITTSSPLYSEELDSILYLQGVSCSSPTTFTVHGHLQSPSPLKLAGEASLPNDSRPLSRHGPYTQVHGWGAATSPHAWLDTSSTGKEKISGFFNSDSTGSDDLGLVPIVGHDPSIDPLFTTCHSSSGPTVYGLNDKQKSGYLQLAQQIFGAMGQSSSVLTIFGPSALHFYFGLPQTTSGLMFFGPPLNVSDPH